MRTSSGSRAVQFDQVKGVEEYEVVVAAVADAVELGTPSSPQHPASPSMMQVAVSLIASSRRLRC